MRVHPRLSISHASPVLYSIAARDRSGMPYGRSYYTPTGNTGYHGAFPPLGGPTTVDHAYFPDDSFSAMPSSFIELKADADQRSTRRTRRASQASYTRADAADRARYQAARARVPAATPEGRVIVAPLDQLPRIEAQEAMRAYIHQMRMAQRRDDGADGAEQNTDENADGGASASAGGAGSNSMQSSSSQSGSSSDVGAGGPQITMANAGASGRAMAEGYIPVYDPRSMNYPSRRGLSMNLEQAIEAQADNVAAQRTALFMPKGTLPADESLSDVQRS